jgi:cytidylate kinase
MIFTVAIDGPAAAGKGTIARAVAGRFGYLHLDTGLLYRATARRVLAGEDPVAAARALGPDDLAGAGLRTAEVGQEASRVAAMPEVRATLLAFQRDMARRPGGTVLDGRDIGTVICPEAEVKLFVTADDATRAHRRWLELRDGSPRLSEAAVLADLKARDARDAGRDAAPMRPADDACILDTSRLSIEEAAARAIEVVEAARGRAGS